MEYWINVFLNKDEMAEMVSELPAYSYDEALEEIDDYHRHFNGLSRFEYMHTIHCQDGEIEKLDLTEVVIEMNKQRVEERFETERQISALRSQQI